MWGQPECSQSLEGLLVLSASAAMPFFQGIDTEAGEDGDPFRQGLVLPPLQGYCLLQASPVGETVDFSWGHALGSSHRAAAVNAHNQGRRESCECDYRSPDPASSHFDVAVLWQGCALFTGTLAGLTSQSWATASASRTDEALSSDRPRPLLPLGDRPCLCRG